MAPVRVLVDEIPSCFYPPYPELLRDLTEAFIHNPAMKDFRNLKVWEKAHLLTLALYWFGS